MTNSRSLSILLAIVLGSCSVEPNPKVVSLSDSSLTSIFVQLAEKSNPFEFYKSVYENFRFELKSTVVQSTQNEVAPPLESVTIYESNEEDETRFYKKSLDPISEIEWREKEGKDYIRYDDSAHYLRTSYNPIFEKWKKGVFEDIASIFDLKTLENKPVKSEKNAWNCFESEQQKICLDSKTGLPVYGKAIKKLKEETAISMVFSISYGEDAIPAKKQEDEKKPEPEKKQDGEEKQAPVKAVKKPQKQTLPKKK